MEESELSHAFLQFRVTLVHRRDDFRASKIMLDRAKANAKIHWRTHQEIIEVLGATDEKGRKMVNGAILRNTKSGKTEQVPTNGVFVAIGHSPNTELFRGLIDMNEVGWHPKRRVKRRSQTFPAFSPAAIARITFIVRP